MLQIPRRHVHIANASKGGIADYSGVTYEKIERQMGVFWPCYSHDPRTGAPTPDDPGTPRLFAPDSYNPIAKGAGPFYFPDGKAHFQELGRGAVDLKAAFDAAVALAPEWIVYEQDRSDGEPTASVRESREYLKKLGV